MPSRPSVKSAFDNLRPTIVREPSRTSVSVEAEARLLDKPIQEPSVQVERSRSSATSLSSPFDTGTLLQKKKRGRLLLVSFRMPQGLKERLEEAAKKHELNQTDLINEAIELNLKRYL